MKDYEDPFEDNEAFDSYKTPSDAVVIQGPIYGLGVPTDAMGWWVGEWVRSAAVLGYGERLEAAKKIMRDGSLLRLEISYGTVYGQVQGTDEPYDVMIYVDEFNNKDWKIILSSLAQESGYVANLLVGEMPRNIDLIFQKQELSLFLMDKDDIVFECSCSDYHIPCQHGAVLFHVLAEILDKDPFLLFHLRGRSRLSVLRALGSAEFVSKNINIESFWADSVEGLQLDFSQTEPFILSQLGGLPMSLDNQLRTIYHELAEFTEERLKELDLI